MLTYSEVSYVFKMLLQICLVTILVLQISSCVSVSFRAKRPGIAIIQLLGIFMNAAVLVFFMADYQTILRQVEPTFVVRSVQGIPVLFLIVFLIIVTASSIGSSVYLRKIQKNMITDSSIKESTDDLPMGLCFAKKDGLTLLVNRKMYMLSLVIMGTALQNARQFWEKITSGELSEEVVRVKGGEEPILLLPNDSVWTFSKTYIKIDREEVVQILAVDTTDLYNLRFELEKKNASLKEMNSRLQKYGENVTDLVREEEILATKVKIHADMGSALLATRYYLNNPRGKDQANALIKSWDYNVSMLYNEVKQEAKEDVFQHLNEAAAAVGVTIEVNGMLPKNNIKAERLIVAAGRECLTNTVRHGAGDKVIIWIQENQLYYHVEYTNNGIVPEESIKEGGGLMGLRRRVEDMGGNMQVVSIPQFMLIINIPKEKG